MASDSLTNKVILLRQLIAKSDNKVGELYQWFLLFPFQFVLESRVFDCVCLPRCSIGKQFVYAEVWFCVSWNFMSVLIVVRRIRHGHRLIGLGSESVALRVALIISLQMRMCSKVSELGLQFHQFLETRPIYQIKDVLNT